MRTPGATHSYRSEHPKINQADWLFGRREVIELLESGVKIVEVLLLRGGEGDTYEKIIELAEARGVALRLADRREFDDRFPGEIHQGAAAVFHATPPLSLDELLANNEVGLLVMLDGVTDPHNVGAVIRSAEVFGAKGVILPERRSAGLTPTVIKTSAGAALRLPVAIASNLAQSIRFLKDRGFWIYGLDPEASQSIWEIEYAPKSCFILGSEGRGLARLTRDLCDVLIAIPQSGKIGSLNISASAAIVLAEVSRRGRNQ